MAFVVVAAEASAIRRDGRRSTADWPSRMTAPSGTGNGCDDGDGGRNVGDVAETSATLADDGDGGAVVVVEVVAADAAAAVAGAPTPNERNCGRLPRSVRARERQSWCG